MSFQLKVYPMSFHPSISNIDELEKSNKICLPPSILQYLLDLDMDTNPIFEIKKKTDYVQSIYMTCQEFSALEGVCYIPYQQMNQGWISEGEIVDIHIEKNIPKGTSILLQPSSDGFLQIENYKEKLEELIVKKHSVLSSTDTIEFKGPHYTYIFDVINTEPADIIDMRETDVELHMTISREQALLNKIKKKEKPNQVNSIQYKKRASYKHKKSGYEAFSGKGNRLGT